MRVPVSDFVQKTVERKGAIPKSTTQRVEPGFGLSKAHHQLSQPLMWVIIMSVFFTLSPVALWLAAHTLIAPSRLPAAPMQIVSLL